MTASRPLYCWDACVLIAWMSREADKPLADIDLVADEIDRNESDLIVPVTAFSEVLEVKQPPEAMALFERFVRRSNVDVVNTTEDIARRAGLIRSRGLTLPQQRKIKTPDALFLATAILCEASVFHTLEGSQLQSLSGTPVVDGLRIELPKPLSGHQSLLDRQ